MEEIKESFIGEDKILTAKDKPYYQRYCGTQEHLKFLTFKIISLPNCILWGSNCEIGVSCICRVNQLTVMRASAQIT